MAFKEFIQGLGKKGKERKEMLRQMDEQVRMQRIIQERQLSANERELNRYLDEERESQIKQALEYQRKKRQHDLSYNHNPLSIPNITNHTDWEVLKEHNMFKGNNNMFTNQNFIHKSNKNLLKNNKKLYGI